MIEGWFVLSQAGSAMPFKSLHVHLKLELSPSGRKFHGWSVASIIHIRRDWTHKLQAKIQEHLVTMGRTTEAVFRRDEVRIDSDVMRRDR